MNKEKRKKLEAKGWKVTTATEFLELSNDEEQIVELRLALSEALKERRLQENLTQENFAKILRSSQSRVAKMEAGDSSVTFDLLIRSLFKAGVDKKKLSKIIAN